MANPFLTENEKRNLAIKNNAYNQVLQGFEQPQQEDATNDDGFLGAAKRAGVGTLASMAGGLGYLLGAEGMAEQIGAQRVDTREIGLGGLAHDAGPEIDQIGPVPDDDGAGRAAGIGAGVGRARAEQDELRFEFLHIRHFPLPA